MKQIIIIGGGASGMACALTAAREGARVTVLERERRPLRKLAASGNGRGNLFNRGELRYAGDAEFAAKVLGLISSKEVEAFWQRVGVPLVQEEDRVYPSCFQASQAAEALRLCAAESGVEVRCSVRATHLQKNGNRFIIEAEEAIYGEDKLRKNGKIKNGELLETRKLCFEADSVVLAFGGCAAPEFGTDGSAYALGTGLGHHVTELQPALCALTTSVLFPPALQGQRARVKLSLQSAQGDPLAASSGEILFADHAVSGIAAMQLARYYQKNCRLHIDFSPMICGEEISSSQEIFQWLEERKRQFPNRPPERFLQGCASDALLRLFGEPGNATEMAKQITDYVLPISGTRGFPFAQVTAGGFSTKEFDPQTLESRLCPKLYALGEALDVDGDCGGFNLMFAVASGILAGKKIGNQ